MPPFEPGRHPRGRTGKFVRGFHQPSVDDLHREWADLDRQLLPFVEANNTHDPAAERMLARQVQIGQQLHRQQPKVSGMMNPGVGEVHDLVVVGAGPAGLTSAIYGASEGLDTVVLDAARKAGGQIGFTSRMENMPGFPLGVTGRKYADDGELQARRLGADMELNRRVVRMTYDPATKVKSLHLADGSVVRGKAVVIAGGLQFRHLTVPNGEAQGVCYGDANELVRECAGGEAVIVGGANSAGQGAIKVAAHAKHVTILLRSGQLSDKMSDYLVKQIASSPNITVRHGEIANVSTDAAGHVAGCKLKDGTEIKTRGIGVYIGSAPHAEWADQIERDAAGRVVVGQGGSALETSVPGVFAAGDVRVGGAGRVAAAVGDGAQAVQQVHPFLTRLHDAVQESDLPSPPVDYENDGTDEWLALMGELDGMTDNDVDEDEPHDLLESIAEWEKARHHKDKFGPMPGGVKMSPGRGPNGKLRNFKAMSTGKLTHTLRMLAVHGEDPHAHREAMKAAAEKLGVKFEGNTIKIPEHFAIAEHAVLQRFWLDAAARSERRLCECGAPGRGTICQRGHRIEEWGPAAWAASAKARGSGLRQATGEAAKDVAKVHMASAVAGAVGGLDPTGLSGPALDVAAEFHRQRAEEHAEERQAAAFSPFAHPVERHAAMPVEDIHKQVHPDIKALQVGQHASYHVPEGQITVTRHPKGFQVEGGGHALDPDLRRGTRVLGSHKDAAREVAERIHGTASAELEHTNQMAEHLSRLSTGQTFHAHGLTGPGANVTRLSSGRLRVQHPGKAAADFGDVHEAANDVKVGIRAAGGQFHQEGHGTDPLERSVIPAHPRAEVTLHHLATGLDPATFNPEITPGKAWAEQQGENLADAINSGAAAHFITHVVPHVASVLPHMAHLATIVHANLDAAERDLEEVTRRGNGREIVRARTRVNALQRQWRDLEYAAHKTPM